MSTLTLLVPGLGRLPVAGARREVIPADGIAATLAWLAGIDGPLPAGALSWLAVTGARPPGAVSRIDPVHLAPDGNGLRLMPASALDLDDSDSTTLAAYLAHGHQVEIVRAGPWFWMTTQAPEGGPLESIHDVSGMQIGSFLPEGGARMRLRQWLNEAQMILHDCPVNRRRLDAGYPTINSVWPWGGGTMPAAVSWSFTHAYADDPVVAGIALLAGRASQASLRGFADVETAGSTFAWVDDPEEVGARWIAPAVNALYARKLDELVLLDAAGSRWRLKRTLRGRITRMLRL